MFNFQIRDGKVVLEMALETFLQIDATMSETRSEVAERIPAPQCGEYWFMVEDLSAFAPAVLAAIERQEALELLPA